MELLQFKNFLLFRNLKNFWTFGMHFLQKLSLNFLLHFTIIFCQFKLTCLLCFNDRSKISSGFDSMSILHEHNLPSVDTDTKLCAF